MKCSASACAFINGEFADTCAQCGAKLLSLSGPSRTLKQKDSHEEAPPKKTPKTNEDLDDSADAAASDDNMGESTPAAIPPADKGEDKDTKMDDELGLSVMMKSMMRDMKERHDEIKGMMESTTKGIQEAKHEATEAKQSAMEAKAALDGVEAEVKQLKVDMMTKSDASKLIKEEVSKAFQAQVVTSKTAEATKSEITAVIGGLGELSDLEEAENWLQERLAALKAPAPIEVFKRSESSRESFLPSLQALRLPRKRSH
jgi:hypothetical protein